METVTLYEYHELDPLIRNKVIWEYNDWFYKLAKELCDAVHYIQKKYSTVKDSKKLLEYLQMFKLEKDLMRSKTRLKGLVVFIRMFKKAIETGKMIDDFLPDIDRWRDNMLKRDFQDKFLRGIVKDEVIRIHDLRFDGGFLKDGKLLRY